MKILMLIDSLARGGRERRLLELLKSFKPIEDIEVALVVFSKRIEYPEIHDMGISLHILERKPAKDPRVFFRLNKVVKKEKPDLIHSWGIMPSIYVIPTVKLQGIKFLNAFIANAPKGLNYLNSQYFRAQLTFPSSDMVVGNSKAGLKAYDAPSDKSLCIYNGFDFNRVRELEDSNVVRERLGIQAGKVVGMVGAFYDRKDYYTYIDAACKYLEKRQDVTFLAIGDGPNFEKCKAKVPQKMQDRILFPGLLKQVESVVNIFDIGVLSTNAEVHGEGISNSIMEYMVLEKPVVASIGGGTNEIVVDKKTGFLVPTGDADALVEKLEYLVDHPDIARSFGQEGRERIHQHFSLDRMEKDYLELYEKMLGKKLRTMA